MRQSTERKRLEHAYRELKDKGAEIRKAAEAAPMKIRLLGLGPGVATLAAETGGGEPVAAILAKWLLQDCPWKDMWGAPMQAVANIDNLMQCTGSRNQKQYRNMMREAEHYLVALKRFGTALGFSVGAHA